MAAIEYKPDTLKSTIVVGDLVDIELSYDDGGGVSLLNCEVLGLPQAEGDAWRLRWDGRLVYVQRYCAMYLRKGKA